MRETSAAFLHGHDRDCNCNPGMCPDQELSQQLAVAQDDAQSTEPLWGAFVNFWLMFFAPFLSMENLIFFFF